MQESHIAKLSPPTGNGERDLRPRGFAGRQGLGGVRSRDTFAAPAQRYWASREIARRVRQDMIDSKERPDITEPTHSTDPTENAETAEPIEPTDRTDPTDPTDPTESIEFFEQMESIDPSDRIDHLEASND